MSTAAPTAATPTDPTADLWARRDAGDATARDRIVHDNLGLVYHAAQRLARPLGVRAELAELVSAGTLGLMQAVDTFDPARGYTFGTFAALRVRGAMLDELRNQDHAPR